MSCTTRVLCKDGVVLGADSSTTFVASQQFATIEQQSNKVAINGQHVIVAGTGSVGLDQRSGAVVQRAVAANVFDGDKLEAVKTITREAILDLQQTFARLGQYGAHPPRLARRCFVFHRNGQPLGIGGVRAAWKRAIKRAGLDGMLVHDLRRTAAHQ